MKKRIIAIFLTALVAFSFSVDTFAIRQVRLGQSTISHIAEYFHNEYGMSTHDLTQAILDFNGISWEGARHLGPNTIIRLPPTRAEYEQASREIANQKNAKIAEIRNNITAQKNRIIAEMSANFEREKNRIRQEIRDSVNSQKNNVISQSRAAINSEESKRIQEIRTREQAILREIEEQKNKKLAEIKRIAERKEIIHNGEKIVPKALFKGRTRLEILSIPMSVERIEPGTFESCKWIGILTCDPKWMTHFNKEAIIEIKIPNGVKMIPRESFSGCTHLRSIEIPNSVTTIEDGAFKNCSKLEVIKIPASVKQISPTAFDGCVNLKNIECSPELRKQLETGLNITYGTESLSSADYAAYKNLEGIEIPTSVTSIDPSVLKGFSKLKCIKCDPKWLKFVNKENLKVVIIPDEVKSITKEMFKGCVNLECLIIPNSVGSIEHGSFDGLNKLTCVQCDSKWLDKIDKSKLRTLLISEGTKNILKVSIQGCVNLENLVIPETVEGIEPDTFKDCKKLVNIKCDERWSSVFNTKAIIKNGTTEIKKSEFANWLNLRVLVIPNSVKSIEPGTFDNCRNLEFVKCEPKFFGMIYKEGIKVLEIPDGVERINRSMLKGFSSLECIELPDSVKAVDKDAFDDCTNLRFIKCKEELLKDISEKAKKQFKDRKSRIVYTFPDYNFESNSAVRPVKEVLHPAVSAALTEFKPKETTVDDLVKVDSANAKYANEIRKVLSATVNKDYKGSETAKDKSISTIGDITAAVCNKIYWSDKIASKNGFRICPRPVQALAVIRLADEIINGHGAIGEIKTGEGKSFIISVLGIVLSKYGRKIDVVTSNLELARRDEEDQRMYYELFGIGSGVLYNTKSEKDFMDGSRYVSSGQTDEKLESFNTEVFKSSIVYSTNGNFEFVYLHSLFRKKPLRDGIIRPYDVVLVDEVDNMFIDQESSPSVIARYMPLAYARDVLEIVYYMRNYEVEEIIKQLKQFFPNCGNFNADNVGMLRRAAKISQEHERDVDYIVENGEIIIIDSNTGYKKPGSRWNNYIHEMVEIKEGLRPKSPSISYCEVTQRGYFNLYRSIAGVTGTVGSKSDEEQLKGAYKVNIFRVPRHFESQKVYQYFMRPGNIASIFGLVYNEIIKETKKGRPVLVIMDSIQNVHLFCMASGLAVNTIEGVNPSKDRAAIKVAGNSRQVTIATSAAGRGMDIKLSSDAKKAGGLHVIIPMLMPNQRALEQAAGRSGRQGQPGSVSIYRSSIDLFRSAPRFEPGHDNLTKLELRFSEYLRKNHPWIYEGQGKYGLGELIYPYGTNVSEVVEITASRISQRCFRDSEDGTKEPLKDLMLSMALIAWGTFFTDMSNHVEECASMAYCEQKYQGFIKDLSVWLSPDANTEDRALAHIRKEKLKRVDWGEVAVIAGITVVSTGICVLCPAATPWVIAGGVAAGAIAEGGMEVYRESRTGEYNWAKILTKTLGGGLKGALAASPLKPLATGLSVGAVGALEDYIYCLECGETHEQALKSAVINGALEGVTTGGTKWLGNVIENRIKARRVAKESSTAGITKGANTAREAESEAKSAFNSSLRLSAKNGQKIRVGQWMSKAEYESFVRTGEIPRSNVLTKGKYGYIRQANMGDYYVEFNIDSSLLAPKNEELGWALIKPKNDMYQKLYRKRGLDLPLPIGEDIVYICTKK